MRRGELGPQQAVTLRLATSPLCELGSQRPATVAGPARVPGRAELLNVQNGIPTEKSRTPGTALYLHNGRGIAACMHDDVL
jgi:hypothetical protein